MKPNLENWNTTKTHQSLQKRESKFWICPGEFVAKKLHNFENQEAQKIILSSERASVNLLKENHMF